MMAQSVSSDWGLNPGLSDSLPDSGPRQQVASPTAGPTPPEDGGFGTTVHSLGCKARCSYFWGSRKSSQVRGRAVIRPLALPIHRLPTQSQFSAKHLALLCFPLP